MKQWTKEILIDTPIDQVWNLFDGSIENMQKIMPQVIENTPVKITPEGTGSIYRQKYKEGKRIEEYDVTTLEFLDTPEQKRLKVGFVLANCFGITALYEIKRVDSNKTHFKYTATNEALKWFIKIFLLFGSDKIVVKFVEQVKKVAESEYQKTI